MYLTNLADLARHAGLDVTEVPGWAGRGHADMKQVRTITVHHTAGPTAKRNPDDYPSLKTVRDGRPGLAGPLAQLGIGRSGRVYTIAAGLCWHAGFSRHIDFTNSYAVGIEIEGAGVKGEPWPAAQVDAAVALCAALVIAYGLDVTDVRGHKETCDPPGRKVDPSFDMDLRRSAVRREIAEQRAGRSAAGAPRKAPKVTLHRVLKYRGRLRPMLKGADVKAVQRAIGFVGKDVDGRYGPGTKGGVIAFQRKRGLVPDGVVGSATADEMNYGWSA